jgi:hypothetical protein
MEVYPFPFSLPLQAVEARQAGAAGVGLGLGYTPFEMISSKPVYIKTISAEFSNKIKLSHILSTVTF